MDGSITQGERVQIEKRRSKPEQLRGGGVEKTDECGPHAWRQDADRQNQPLDDRSKKTEVIVRCGKLWGHWQTWPKWLQCSGRDKARSEGFEEYTKGEGAMTASVDSPLGIVCLYSERCASLSSLPCGPRRQRPCPGDFYLSRKWSPAHNRSSIHLFNGWMNK